MAENTFLGLQPYTEADAYRFKGRTEESQELFRMIVRNDYTVCYAESGEGKTSLLNAGVFPLLRQNMYFPIAITFTSDDYERTPDSFDTIIDRCIRNSIAEYNETNKGINVEYKLCSTDFRGLDCQTDLQHALSQFSWWKLRNYKPQAMGLTFTPVFVFDQFEEVFNMPGSIVWTNTFFEWLENVSSDSCPDEIIKKVRSIIGGKAAFPTIKEEKDFKAVFSIRKEFIGELDYWGMQKSFIPSLKDNRYCLKALTYEGAQKVMTQQQRFEEAKVKQVLDYFVQQYSREPEKTKNKNLPVIPALLLSVVCDSWEKDIDFFSDKDENDIGQSLNIILERFHDDALSSIVNELSLKGSNNDSVTIREDIETVIFALVDSNGKRVRRKSSELAHLDFDAKYKEILSDKRIIKISKIDGEDYVEIIHDALCAIIDKRKKTRQEEQNRRKIKEAEEKAEEAKRKEEETRRKEKQREDITSSFFLLISLIFNVWLLSTIFLNKTILFGLIKYTDVKTFHIIDTVPLFAILTNLTLIPFLICSVIKKIRITHWLSVYGVISNAFLSCFLLVGQEKIMNLRLTLAVVSVGIPLVTLVYSYRFKLLGEPNKGDLKVLCTSIPLLSYFFVFASFIFCLCVFNTVLGLPQPCASSWGLIVIPLLAYAIIRIILRQKLKKVALLFFSGLLGLLVYNSSCSSFAFSSNILFMAWCLIVPCLISLFNDVNLIKKTCAIVGMVCIIASVVILNIGFNLLSIQYDSVTRVCNWVDVLCSEDNARQGILNACTGDTILPCQFDSIKDGYGFIETDALKFEQTDVSDAWGFFSSKNGRSNYKCLYFPLTELYIYRTSHKQEIDTLFSDSIQVYASKTYRELLNANVSYLQTGHRYTLHDIQSLPLLFELQRNEFCTALQRNEKHQTLVNVFGNQIVDNQDYDRYVADLNRSFARTFYLCMLKDRIVQNDSINLFMLAQEFIPLFFYNSSDCNLSLNAETKINVDSVSLLYRSTISAKDLRKNSIYTWHNMAKSLIALDLLFNQDRFNEYYKSQTNSLRNVLNETHALLKDWRKEQNELQKKQEVLNATNEEIIKNLSQKLNNMQRIDRTMGQISEAVKAMDNERLQIDEDFLKLINEMFKSLSPIVLNSQNVYNSVFLSICQDLYVVATFRLYDMSSVYLDELEKMNRANNHIYTQFRLLDSIRSRTSAQINDIIQQ